MFYEPSKGHGLPRDPMTSLVVPRPIAWVSTLSADGIVNLAPFSFYNIVSTRPPAVMFSSYGYKDSARNAAATGEFVVSVPSYETREQMVTTSQDVAPEISEAQLAGVEMVPSTLVRPPRVRHTLVALECRYLRTVELEADSSGTGNCVVFGKVEGVFIDDGILVDGFVRWPEGSVLFRLGYLDYGVVGAGFPMSMPGKN
ncbi:MAG: flavin reductase family protein [Burkholderiaceae bacterium]